MIPAKIRGPEVRLSPEQLQNAIKASPTGTTIFCHNPDSIGCWFIRRGLGGPDDHTVTLVWEFEQPYILEATPGELSHLKGFTTWLLGRMNNTFRISPCMLDDEGHKRLNNCFQKKYDWVAVIFFMAIFRFFQFFFRTEVWLGPMNDRAQNRYFCFEMSAYIRGLDKWWMRVPKDFPTD